MPRQLSLSLDAPTPSTDDQMYSSRTVPELLRAIQYLTTVARGLGMQLTTDVQTGKRPPGTAHGFRHGTENSGIYGPKDHGKLWREAERLHGAVDKFRAGLDASDEKELARGSPGLRRLRSDPRAEAIRQQTLTDQHVGRQEAARRIAEERRMTEETTAAAAPAAKKAKKVAKKAAKKAKKAAPKKAAKKAASNGRTRFNPDHKITIINKENPRRKGSAAHDRLAKVISSGGRTVKSFKESGGREATLSFAIENKIAKVG